VAALDSVYQSALDIDYTALSTAQDRAIAMLRAGTVRVRTPAGTDLSFRIGERPFNKQNGDASPERMQTARVRIDREIELPAGVIRVAPLEETVNGRIVIPMARFGDKIVRHLRLEIKNGQVVRIEADENLDAVEAALNAGGEAARRFREFALGFNPKLQMVSHIPLLPYYGYGAGVVRLSLGDNQELGGSVRGNFVRWFFFPDATVEVDGRALVRDGKLVEGLR
jgi:leucyl aminopeptidase (aminopeptidase T)